MAQQAFDELIPFTPMPNALDNTTLLVDASGEKTAFVFQISHTGTLNGVGFRTGAVVQAQTVKVSFQGVSGSDGNPDGTIGQYRNISIADTDDNVWKTTGLITSDGTDGGTKRSVTAGDWIAVVFEHNPFNTGDVFRLSACTPAFTVYNMAYSGLYTGAAWAKSSFVPILALIYSDGSVYYTPPVLPFSALTTMAFNSGSSNPYRGLKFTSPGKVTCSGALCMLNFSAGSSANVKLYDSGGSLLATSDTRDGDITRAAGTPYGTRFQFSTTVDLTSGGTYYLLLVPQNANNISLPYGDVDTSQYLDQLFGGQAWHYAEGTGSGVPTATTTRRPALVPVFSAVSDGAGGLLTHPGMSGGMRG